MVETPKLSSLAGELLRFFLFSSLLLGVIISVLLFSLGKVEPYQAVGGGFGVALVWVVFNILWMRGKIGELFGRLMYVIDILEERHRDRMVVPIPIHEEVLEVIQSVRELVRSFEERYERNIRELEDQLETMSENASKILVALEELQEGKTRVELPSGLDPVGAIGQSLEQVVGMYHEKFSRIKALAEECRKEINLLTLLLEEKGDKIDVNRLQEGMERLMQLSEEVRGELSSLKDI